MFWSLQIFMFSVAPQASRAALEPFLPQEVQSVGEVQALLLAGVSAGVLQHAGHRHRAPHAVPVSHQFPRLVRALKLLKGTVV